MYYAQVGAEIYWMNGEVRGIFNCPTGVCRDWVARDYVGPETNRTFSDVPIGTCLVHYQSRLYIAQGNVVWYTEPYAYSWVDRARNFLMFPGVPTDMFSSKEGMFVSILEKDTTFFVTGNTAKDLTPRPIAPAIIPGTLSKIKGSEVGMDSEEIVFLGTTKQGIILITGKGEVKNLTRNRLTYPATNKGAAAVTSRSYIVSLQP
jgi:hypothetical protein